MSLRASRTNGSNRLRLALILFLFFSASSQIPINFRSIPVAQLRSIWFSISRKITLPKKEKEILYCARVVDVVDVVVVVVLTCSVSFVIIHFPREYRFERSLKLHPLVFWLAI